MSELCQSKDFKWLFTAKYIEVKGGLFSKDIVSLHLWYVQGHLTNQNVEQSKGFPFYGVTLTYADSAHFWIWPS
jgi:hypothetical protein